MDKPYFPNYLGFLTDSNDGDAYSKIRNFVEAAKSDSSQRKMKYWSKTSRDFATASDNADPVNLNREAIN